MTELAPSASNIDDRAFLAAIREMRRCEGRPPKVGAVIVLGGEIVAVGHRAAGMHAERMAIEAALASHGDLRQAVIYSTLEPCVETGSTQECCADLINRVGIRKIYIGRYDPNSQVYRAGWKRLRDGGARLFDFPEDLRDEIDDTNSTFMGQFKEGLGVKGGAKFDFTLNDGHFDIHSSDTGGWTIRTKWSLRDNSSVHAYGSVALARHAKEFDEIDDPFAFASGWTCPVGIGEIGVFMSEAGAALVKVKGVEGGPQYGLSKSSVHIEWVLRERRPRVSRQDPSLDAAPSSEVGS
jgi:diaminohydroxyphosphoribosylaminopyrimidine deaminase/5-amino-6-(5-phosphoribosylamino)uracil reductase